MIRKYIYLFFISLVIIQFHSCVRDDEEYQPPEMVTEIIPSTGDTDNYDDIYGGSTFNLSSDKPLISMADDEVLISTLNLNLDLDTHEEQILVTKKRANPDGNIHIIVADYSNVSKGYTRAWESITSAENIRSFLVYLDDIIGDHNNEIVCSGRDSSGRTTLDIFWKNTSDNQLGYIPVFRTAAKGTIEINQSERSRAYHQGLKDGESYTITVTTENSSGDDNFSLFREIFFWDFPSKHYIKLSEEELESNTVVENRLSEVFEGDESLFFDFITGPWYKDEQIIYFDPAESSATFFANDIQENYTWINSYKVMSNLLYARCRNDIINYIENEIYIRVINLDEVMITVRDIDNQTRKKSENDIWTGRYIRMNGEMKTDTVSTLDSVVGDIKLPVLNGQYISDSGDIVEFYGSDFYFKNSFEEFNGGYAIFAADIVILNIKILDSRGIVTEERSFAVDYRETKSDTSIERVLVLTPGNLSIYGFHISDTDFFRFTQVETLDVPADEDE